MTPPWTRLATALPMPPHAPSLDTGVSAPVHAARARALARLEGLRLSMRRTSVRKLLYLALTALCVGLSACQSAQLAVPDTLGAALPVRGAQGWMPGRVLQFGEFSTVGKVSGLGVQSRERAQGLSLQGLVLTAHAQLERSQKRLTFTLQQAGGGATVAVTASGSLQADLRHWELLLPGVTVQGNTTRARQQFVGTLLPSLGDQALPGWRFALMSPKGDEGRGVASLGWAHREGDAPEDALLLLPLRGLRSADGRHVVETDPASGPPGFEIQRAGRALAAVSRLDGGTVWFAEGLDAPTRLACAGLVATLLLREELADTL